MSGVMCLEGVWRVSGGVCLEGVWSGMFGGVE